MFRIFAVQQLVQAINLAPVTAAAARRAPTAPKRCQPLTDAGTSRRWPIAGQEHPHTTKLLLAARSARAWSRPEITCWNVVAPPGAV